MAWGLMPALVSAFALLAGAQPMDLREPVASVLLATGSQPPGRESEHPPATGGPLTYSRYHYSPLAAVKQGLDLPSRPFLVALLHTPYNMCLTQPQVLLNRPQESKVHDAPLSMT